LLSQNDGIQSIFSALKCAFLPIRTQIVDTPATVLIRMKMTSMLTSMIFVVIAIATGSYTIAQTTPVTTSKLETLPTTARLIPGQYIAILATTIEIADFEAAVPVDEFNNNEPILTICYKYNHSSPSSAVPMRGVAVSNVYENALEWLLGSDLVVSVTPVCTEFLCIS
jgi:hypothetical protein